MILRPLTALTVIALCSAVAAAQPADTKPHTDKPHTDKPKTTAPAQIQPPKDAPGADKDKKKAEAPAVTLKVGDKAPALTVDQFLKGEPVTGFESGKVYVVEFWATWCGPCIESIPHLTELQKKYGDDLTVIGMASSERAPKEGDADKRIDNLQSFIKKQGKKMEYRVAYDSKRAMSNAWMRPAGRNTIPTAFIVDREGKIAFIGHPSEMDDALKTAMDAKAGTKSKG